VKPPAFEYASPETIDEALALLEQHGDDARVLAGGQSLVPLLALRLAAPSALIDLDRVEGLRHINEGDTTSIGAMTTHREVENNEFLARRCPMLREAMAVVGHVAIRNRGTVGGSCAHADPAAEWPALAMVLDAKFHVRGSAGTRTVSAKDLFVSIFTTSLEVGEIVTEIQLDLPPEDAGTAFMELSRRHGDFGIAGVAAVVQRSDGKVRAARLGVMGGGATPIRAVEAEQLLAGEPLSDATLDAAAEATDRAIDPTGDVHGSVEFRRNAVKVLTKRAIRNAFERAKGGD
jgi:aerobic carbon-monoxide dehydrogenase medium subunit